MKKRKIHIGLIVLTIILLVFNFVIDFRQGLSRADIFNYSCEVILVLIWIVGVVNSKPNE